MVYEFRNKARIYLHPNQESVITIEARTEKEAKDKLWRLVRYGKEIGFYDYRSN